LVLRLGAFEIRYGVEYRAECATGLGESVPLWIVADLTDESPVGEGAQTPVNRRRN
jgi:hypothetical protein